MAQITFKDSPIHTIGQLPEKGGPAPDFVLCTGSLEDISLSNYKGKTLILNIVPSLDTGVCQASARNFNKCISSLQGVVVANVSMDLPFAQGRFCSSEGLKHIENLSAFRNPEFGTAYGVTILDGALKGLFSRAVVVIDPEGKVIYTQQVPEIAQEPDYEAVLNLLN
ncbi:MAG: thiol peroxidase [Kiritimatiellia bacterium]